jgi:RNA polymerase sigma-70 factor, ECF subfamily
VSHSAGMTAATTPQSLAGSPGGQPPAVLEAAVRARVAEARALFPAIATPDDLIIRHVMAKLGEEGADLAGVRVPELLLACASAHRDATAIGYFERAYFGEVDAAARRFDSLPLTIDDVRQRLREQLYLHDPPALLGYAGRGDLGGWLRAVALHMLINVATRGTREQPREETFFDAVVDMTPDAEAAFLRQACRDEFEKAFSAALARLAPRDKLLLRYAFADGQNVDQIGAIFRVHRATAARWVAKARDQLVDQTRTELMGALRIEEGEAASIVRAALSRMGTTLLRRLG